MPTAARSMSSRRPRRRAGADAVEFARHHLHMWDPQMAAFTRDVSRAALRPARAWQIRRAERPLYDGDARPRRARRPGRARTREGALVGLSMGGMVGQWLGANAPERIDKLILSNTAAYYRRQDHLEQPHQGGARERPRRRSPTPYEALVHHGFPRARAGDDRAHDARCCSRRRSKAISAAARRCATWTTARCCRRSRRRP